MNFGEHLIDLDELVLRCKDEEARKYIAEAVACYKSGAFRACIVTTWIAVVYDFVYKLRQLELTGDKNAIAKLGEFEKARKNKTPELALSFEKNILDWARDEFEFLSPMQHDDLGRLLVDRNRCAHPSMISAEEIYQPPAELARYHLRNAITNLLQHPPVQGQAALDRLKNDTASEYFPTETLEAVRYFSHGPLVNAKPALVRNFVVALVKTLLIEDHNESEWMRFTTALNAVRQMHRVEAEKAILEQFTKIVLKLSDDDLFRVIQFLDTIPDTWQFLSGDMQSRIEKYILSVDEDEAVSSIKHAFGIPELQTHVLARIDSLSGMTLKHLVNMQPRLEFVLRAVELYCGAKSFGTANELGSSVIIPLISLIKHEEAERIVKRGIENDQVLHSYGFSDVIKTIIEAELLTRAQFKDLLVTPNLNPDYYYKVFPEEKPPAKLDDIPF